MVPGVDFGQPQFPPAVVERALRGFRRETLTPATFHEMENELEIRLGQRIDPAAQPAAPDKIAALLVEQRPVLHALGSLSVRSFFSTGQVRG